MRILIIILGVCLFAISCKKSDDINPVYQDTSGLSLNNDIENLKSRIAYSNEIINFSEGNKSLQYTLVASIEPHTINGHILSATSVTAENDFAYVSFHTRGETIGGEILSLDVSVPDAPVILQSATSTVYDFNDLSLSSDQSKLWVCGDELIRTWGQAFAMELSLNNSHIPQAEANWIKSFDSYSANSITPTSKNGEDLLWITSGSNGGLSVYDQNNPENTIYSFQERYNKHFDASRDYGVTIFGVDENSSVIRVFDLNTLFEYTDYTIPYDVTQLGKNGISVDRNMAYLAMGESGLIAFDLRNGVITDIFRADKDGLANSVFVEKDFIYLAYGAAGLFILDKRRMESLGNWDYEGSCNYVTVVHETVFVANGDVDGFLILVKN
ncbi:MAG: hypothetical protein GQ527_00580 [Bacteroidales bacterium]|nr:hypothetical protein [Bacteroidales bacterium]